MLAQLRDMWFYVASLSLALFVAGLGALLIVSLMHGQSFGNVVYVYGPGVAILSVVVSVITLFVWWGYASTQA